MKQIFENSELQSFFIGTLLGDSYVHNNVFYCKLISKDLIYFKYNFIKDNLTDAVTSIREYDEYTDKNGVSHQKFYVLSVKHPKIKELYELFYPDGVKVYPEGAVSALSNLGFSMWYADDGTTILVQINLKTQGAKNRRIQICTDNFTIEENNKIKQELESLGYTIKVIDRHRNGQVRIQLNGLTGLKFICSLEKYFMQFPSLLYKLDLGYRNESLDKKRYVTEEYKNCYTRVSAHPLFLDRVQKTLTNIKDDIVQTTNEES